ncbi:MAG: type II toxin-antitoxin system HicA family toxin [Bauldia sp.]|nr:type II toxin-antitoxin system HicA family toxin [Bauldia sp.]
MMAVVSEGAVTIVADRAREVKPIRVGNEPYKHDPKTGRVTIAGKPSDDMSPGTLNSILKQAGLRERK